MAHIWAKWLYQPCRLGGLQRPPRGKKSVMVTWLKWGQGGYITRAILGVPNAQCGAKNQKWLCCPHVGKVATSPLPSWGSPTLSWGPQRLVRGQRLERASRSHVGKVASSPLPSWGSAMRSARTKIRNGYVAHMWAKWLHHPCRPGGLQCAARGQKLEMATWPTYGQSGYITPTVLGVFNAVLGSVTLSAGTKPRNGYMAYMWAQWLRHLCPLGGAQRPAQGQK